MSRLNRENVVVAAGRLFAQRGYHATSMRDLGAELGILGGSVYAHVSTKEELLIEVVRRAGRLFGESAELAITTEGTASKRLHALIAGHIGVMFDYPDEVKTFLNEAAAIESSARLAIVAERDRYEAVVRSILKDGVAEGTFRSDLDCDVSAIFVLSILNALDRWYQPTGRIDRRALAAEILQFSTSGMA